MYCMQRNVLSWKFKVSTYLIDRTLLVSRCNHIQMLIKYLKSLKTSFLSQLDIKDIRTIC